MFLSRLIRVALILPWFVLYAWLTRRAIQRRPGDSFREKLNDLLKLREPSVYLDSARVIIFAVWLFNSPDPDTLKATLTRSLPMASPIGIFKLIAIQSVPLWTVDVGTWAYRAAILVALFGIATRAGSLVAALLHVYLWSLSYSFGYSVHNHVVPMALLTIAMCPDPSPFLGKYVTAYREKKPLTSVGSYPAYTIEAVRFAFATVYIQAGMEKALQSGLRYFNGITLQTHFLWGLQKITKASIWPLWLLGVIALLVVVWECAFGLIHFYPKWRIPFVLSAWFFHEVVRHTISINPFTFLESGILFFIPPFEIALLLKGKSAPREIAKEGEGKGLPSGIRNALLVGVAAICALQWAPFFLRRGEYPILSFSLFSGSYVGGEVQPRAGAVEVRSSATDPWRPIDETKALAMHHVAFGEFISSRYSPFYFRDRPLSLPGYAKQDTLDDRREEHCQYLLGEVRKYTHPDATEMRIMLTYYVVSDLEERKDEVFSCHLAPQTVGAAPAPKGLPAQ